MSHAICLVSLMREKPLSNERGRGYCEIGAWV
jgi:hypothetical protein